MTSSKFLDDCIERSRAYVDRGRRAVADQSLDRLNHRTVEGQWSPAQVFEHMRISHAPYLELVQTALKTLPNDTTNAEVAYSGIGKFLTKAAGPTGNAPAPKKFVPGDGPFPAEVVEAWAGTQMGMIELMEAARGKELNQKCFRNPLVKLFKMNLADAFGIFTEHTQRHIEQIEERAASSC